jgi:hypothetical protein
MPKWLVWVAFAGLGVWLLAGIRVIMDRYHLVDGVIQLSEIGGRIFVAVLAAAVLLLVVKALDRK